MARYDLQANGYGFKSGQDLETAKRNGSKGGKASAKANRRRKLFSEAFDELLGRKYIDRNGNEVEGIAALAARVYQEALDGDLSAIRFIRDTVGEMPVQRIETVEISKETYDEVMSILREE